ncbi:hypothetical protein ABVK25_000293 [Lepraria finkii]|uniref:GINS subunit domain-containing protein n=1 Tax=Lepraria finkii TaxID=1340010 RepID=A0ABR4BPN5_9LECA
MDIDDILAEVDGHAIPEETRDLQELTRAWVTERSAPEILPWPNALIERVLERIRKQIELIETQTGIPDPKLSFRLIILQTELERFKFLVRSYLRARLSKIDAYTLHHLTDPATKARLSDSEIQYATAHSTLLHQHYYSSFLGQFPGGLQRMDDSQGGVSMVEGPDLDRAVLLGGGGKGRVREWRWWLRDGYEVWVGKGGCGCLSVGGLLGGWLGGGRLS